MATISLVKEAQKRGERLSFWISIVLSISLAVLTIAFLSYSQMSDIRDDLKTSEKNYDYWIKTGDVFQLDRALSNLIKAHAQIRNVRLYKDGIKVVSLDAENYRKKKLSCEVTYKRNISGAHLVIKYQVSFNEIIYIPLLFFFIYLVLRFSIKSLMTGFGQTLLDPLATFAQSIEAASTLEEIRNLENSQTTISELNVLTKKLSHLGSRVSRAEQQAQKVKELEIMNRISRQVAHDIRSPLTAIEVITKSEGILDAQKLNLLKMASQQIKGIADDLLRRNKNPDAAASSEESTVPVQFKGRISLEDAVSTIKTLLESKKVEHSFQNIRFALYQNISCGKDLYCKVTDLSRILSNLINNSVEAMPEGGLVTVDIVAEADRCMIEVRDTGQGVASEHLERIFLEGASIGKAEGSGLGLYHAKVLIESWGGQIFFNSELNRGTTVKIALKSVG